MKKILWLSKNIPWIIALLLLTNCGKFQEKFGRKQGFTKIGLAVTAKGYHGFLSSLPGRIMVYIVGVNGTSYTTNAQIYDETSPFSINVPNGNYKVIAVGWASSGSPNYYPMEGQAYCGLGSGGQVISLIGGSTSIPINMTTANCNFNNASVFANDGETDTSNFGQTSVQFCNGITATPSCTANDNSYGGNYLKMNFDIYVRDASGFRKIDEYNFGCGFINTNSLSSSKIIPPGSSLSEGGIFALSFSIHSDSNCTSAPIASFSAPNGMDGGALSGVVASDFHTVSTISTLYVDL